MMRIFFILCLLLFFSTFVGKTQTNEYKYWETYGQYVPTAASVAIGWFGVKSQDKCFERISKCGVSIVTESVSVGLVKHLVHKERPDGSANNSFPSGHTATAFTGAELVRYEYGNLWGIGAYTLATAVGLSRYFHKRHYLWDVAGGAVFGFASARFGIFCTNKFKEFYTKRKDRTISFSPYYLHNGFGCSILISGL